MNRIAFIAVALAALAILGATGADGGQGRLALECGASVQDVGLQDRDVSVEKSISMDNGQWSVVHRLLNGHVYNRAYQYQIHDATQPGGPFGWQGTRLNNPDLLMQGAVITGLTGEPTYQEWLYKNGRLVMHTTSDCHWRTAPAPRTASAYAPAPDDGTKLLDNYGPAVADFPKETSDAGEDSIGIVNLGKGVAAQIVLGTRPTMMLIDTGATEMLVSNKLANQMVADGEAEERGEVSVTVADGRKINERVVVIHRMTIGRHVLREVPASVAPEDDAVGLLPFSVLNRVGRFTIDTNSNKLIFG